MDIILVPGFWLDATSWDEVTPALVAAGHRVHPLTLPGKEAKDASRAGIGLRTHIDAVIAALDSLEGEAGFDGEAVLVGHSGGGAIIYGAIDARPDRVVRGIYVDSWPLRSGGNINDELPVEGDDVPFPAWDVFDEADLVDLDDELRAQFRDRAIPEPRAVASDAQALSDERRFDVPATIIACEFSTEALTKWIEEGHETFSDLTSIRDVEYVELPTGHWPQFTKPAELGQVILAAIERS